MREELKPLRLAVAASFAGGEVPDEALLARIDEELTAYGRAKRLSIEEKALCRKELFDSFRGMDILQKALDDESVTEIMVNGLEGIWLEKGSEIIRWDRRFDDRETLEEVIQLMAASVNRLVNTTRPIADLRLPDGSRVNIVLPPAAPDGPVMTIRKFYRSPLTMDKLTAQGSVSPEAAAFLRSAVRTGCNIFISGGTGSGKTTFLNALSEFIPASERVITIEDSLELKLQGLPNLVRLETRDENLEGSGRISIRDLIRTALRMRPTRLIVGEVRGAEALDMLQAMNTGHDGSLSTGHANSAADMLSRLETMALMGGELPLAAVRSQIASAIDLLVHLGRTEGGKRRVLAIEEVKRLEHGETVCRALFAYARGRGLVWTGAQLERCAKWEAACGAAPHFSEGGRLDPPCLR